MTDADFQRLLTLADRLSNAPEDLTSSEFRQFSSLVTQLVDDPLLPGARRIWAGLLQGMIAYWQHKYLDASETCA